MIAEAQWESDLLDWLGEVGWTHNTGSEVESQRASLGELVLREDFLAALRRLNPGVPDQFLQQAASDLLQPKSQDQISENKAFHDLLAHGYRGVTYTDPAGLEQTPTLRLLGEEVLQNQWRAVQQVRIQEKGFSRRFDVVLYVNGLPLAVVELKQAGHKGATIAKAHSQLGTYLHEFGMAFRTVVATVISDGLSAQYGTPFTPLNHYSPWTVDEQGVPVETGPDEHRTRHPRSRALRTGAVPRSGRPLHGLRRNRHRPHQADREAPPVLRRSQSRRQHRARRRLPRQGGRGLAHPRLRQVHGDGAVRQPRHDAPGGCSTPPWSSSPTAPNSTASSTRPSRAPHCSPNRRSRCAAAANCAISSATAPAGASYFTTLQKFGRTSDERDAGA
jgi:type I restriction enzyme R subunit